MKNLEKILNLVKEIIQEYDLLTNEDINVNVSADDTTFQITIKGKLVNQDEIDFKNWCEGIDDNIWEEATEQFENMTGIALSDIGDNYNLFKDVVKQIASNKIEYLKSIIND